MAGAWERELVEKKITEGESEKEISENIVNGHVCQVKKNVNVLFSWQ